MKDIDLLHDVDLNIAKEVVKICNENHFKYYMLGGTMLGAIRHKGFIPWDDDIDLGLPRDDYEKFLDIAPKLLPKSFKMVNFKIDPNYHYYITRILDTETKVIEERIDNINEKYTNASIDIFPLDGTPTNIIFRKIYFFKVLFHRALMSLCYKDSIDKKRKRSKKEKMLLKIMLKLPIEKITTAYKQKCKIDKLLRKQNFSKSKYVGNIMGAYRTKEIVPKSWYGDGKLYQFQDIELNGLEKYDEYLKYTYGDYMKLPPVEKRKTHFKILEIHGKKYKSIPCDNENISKKDKMLHKIAI